MAREALPPDQKAHRLVKQLDSLIRENKLTRAHVLERAGVDMATFRYWCRGGDARIAKMCFMFEALGYDLVAIPRFKGKEESGPKKLLVVVNERWPEHRKRGKRKLQPRKAKQ